jgi:hypothetical protein
VLVLEAVASCSRTCGPFLKCVRVYVCVSVGEWVCAWRVRVRMRVGLLSAWRVLLPSI